MPSFHVPSFLPVLIGVKGKADDSNVHYVTDTFLHGATMSHDAVQAGSTVIHI